MVTNTGLLHIAGAGTCIVVASQPRNTNNLAAPDREHTINLTINQTATCGAGPFIYRGSAIHPAEKNSNPAHTGDRAQYSHERSTPGWGSRE